MRIKVDMRGEEELLRRLTALSELPGLDLALDRAADATLDAARTQLLQAGERGIADSLTIETAADGSRRISSDHPNAWFAENGTRRRPALRWLARSARTGAKVLRQAVGDALARSRGRPTGGGR